MRKTANNTSFGASVSNTLAGANLTQTDLATMTSRSPAYVNQTLTGRLKASPEWVNLVADALKMKEQQRLNLHRAAARDAGYEIDLRKP